MKRWYFITIILFIVSSYAYGQSFNIVEKYRGDPFFSSIDMLKLEFDCIRSDGYWQKSLEEQQKDDERCPLNHLKFDFRRLYKLIVKDPIAYKGNKVQLKLSIPRDNNTKEDLDALGGDISLSLIYQNKVKDKIYLANNSFNFDFVAAGYQRYYIAPSGDIFTLLLIEDDMGTAPTLWKHYKIDTNKMKFILKEMLIYAADIQFQIIPRTQFNVLTERYRLDYSRQRYEDDSCIENEKGKYYYCNEIYKYYENKLKQKIKLLDHKQKVPTDSFPALKQKMDAICLKTALPAYQEDIFPYLSNIMYCSIQQFRQEIQKTEKKLAE